MDPGRIKSAVASVCCVSVADIESRDKHQPVALARQIAMYYVYRSGNNMEQTGRIFNRHHTNVIHAVRCVTNWRGCDWEVRQITEKVEDAIPELKRVHNIDYQI
jgi:chromosomal replication initiation ATPase DnaA